MACPLFLPALGDPDEGRCSADPAALVPMDTLRRCCTAGYARGVCERAARSEADAIRLMIKACHAGTVEVAWSMERNHHPVAVGSISVTEAMNADEPPLERQARACAVEYLRLTGAHA